jgi:hypothetical protein
VLVSTNLSTWTPLTQLTPTTTSEVVIDPSASGTRFYRLHELTQGIIYFDQPTASAGKLKLVLHSPPALRFAIQVSTNFSTWATLDSVTNTIGSVSYTNTIASNIPYRFYRAKLLF